MEKYKVEQEVREVGGRRREGCSIKLIKFDK